MERTWIRQIALIAIGTVLMLSPDSEAGERNLAKRFWSKFRPAKSSADPESAVSIAARGAAGTTRVLAPPEEDEEITATENPDNSDESFAIGAAHEEFAPIQLTLDRLEQLAIENNPAAREAAAVVDKARGQALQAGLYPNPVVGYQASEVGNEGKAGQQGVFVGQEFVTGGKLRLATDVAANEVERLNWQYEAQLQRVLTDVRLRFFQTLGAQREVDIAAQLQGVAEESVKTVEKRRKAAGEATESDVLQLELDLNQVLITKQNAERKLAAAQRRLSYIIGQPELAAVSVTGNLDAEFPTRNFESEWTRLSQSPLLQAAGWRISRANALIRREEAQPIPNIDVQAGVQYDNASQFTIANVQVGVPLPIHNRNQGNICAAVAEYQQAREAQQRLELKLRDHLAEALQAYETALYQEKQYRTVIVPKSDRNLKLTTEAWNVGENPGEGFLKLVIARRSYYEAKLAHVRALTELRVAEASLDGLLLTGGLDAPGE